MAVFTSAAYDGRYLQLSITESVNVISNTSTLNWTLSSVGGSSTYYSVDATTVKINGTQVYYKARTLWDAKVFPAAKGSVSGSISVPHNSDGTKSITVVFSTSVYNFGSVDYGGSMTLTKIDRTAPTVTFGVSNITANGFKISASSSATSDIWQYSTNGGSSWTQFSSTAGTSASVTLSSLSPNTSYSVKVRARKKSNQVYGTSNASSVKTLGGAVLNSVNAVTADSATVNITLNATVYEASYTNTLVIKNGSTAILTLSGLSWTKGTANRTVTLSSDQRTTLLNAMTTVKSFTGTFSVSSFNGSTQVGSTSSKTAAIKTTSSSAPTMTAFTFKDSRSLTSGVTGSDQLFIQNYSCLYITPGTATAKNGASIVKYAATCNGVTSSNTTGAAITLNTISKSGTLDVVVTATDSRGYTVSLTKQITVIPYEKPKVSSISLRRTNDIEAEMQLVFSGSISPITVSGTQKNSVYSVQYRYKKTSASSYGSYTAITGAVTKSGTSFSYSNLELCSLDANSSYDFHVYIQDKLQSASGVNLYFTVPQGTPLLALRKKKIGINNPSPSVALDVTGDGKFSGTLSAANLSGALSVNSISGTLPLSKGGTGATTASAACTKIGALPKSGGTMTGQIKNSSNASSWINGRKNAIICGTVNPSSDAFYPAVSAKTVTGSWEIGTLDESLYFSYATDTNYNAGTNNTFRRRITTDGNFTGCADNVTGTVAVGHGGTGSTNAAGARANLGISCTSLFNGTLTTGSTTFNYGNYKAYIIIGQPTSSSSRVEITVPKDLITTSAVGYQMADETNYYVFKLSYSGSTVTLAYSSRSSTGQIIRVFGVN